MAIRLRRGNQVDFDKNKLLPGELGLVLDTGTLYFCYSAGNTKQLTTAEDVQNLLNATPEAYTALQQCLADLANNPSELTNILNNINNLQSKTSIATNATAGIVKGGGNVTIDADGVMHAAGGTAENTTYTNSTSGLDAYNTQDAIDELAASNTALVNYMNEIENLVNLNKLTSKSVLYKITDTSNLISPDRNLLTNSTFYAFPMGDSVSIASGSDAFVCGNWRVKTQEATCVATKLNSVVGGINLNPTYSSSSYGWIYLRQHIPMIMQFSGRTFTFSADIEVDSTINTDIYIEARINTNDAARVPVVDTDTLVLTTGRHRIACTFTVPDLSAQLSNLDYKNSLEFALRFYNQTGSVNIKVYECIISDGDVVKARYIPNIAYEQSAIEAFYEMGSYQLVGFSTVSGQKRATAQFRTEKMFQPTVTIKDIAGNIGKISTYDISGTRTDNVSYTAISVTSDYVIVIVNASTAAGIGFSYIANCYY